MHDHVGQVGQAVRQEKNLYICMFFKAILEPDQPDQLDLVIFYNIYTIFSIESIIVYKPITRQATVRLVRHSLLFHLNSSQTVADLLTLRKAFIAKHKFKASVAEYFN